MNLGHYRRAMRRFLDGPATWPGGAPNVLIEAGYLNPRGNREYEITATGRGFVTFGDTPAEATA